MQEAHEQEEADEHEAALRAHKARREQNNGEDGTEADGGCGSPLGVDGQYSGDESPLGPCPLARSPQTSRQPEDTDEYN